MIVSNSTFDRIENINNEAHVKCIELLAEELCQKRVSIRHVAKNKTIAKLDDNGKYHIDSIEDFSIESEIVYAEAYNDDMTWHSRVELVDDDTFSLFG